MKLLISKFSYQKQTKNRHVRKFYINDKSYFATDRAFLSNRKMLSVSAKHETDSL